jgi:hypothetical protein
MPLGWREVHSQTDTYDVYFLEEVKRKRGKRPSLFNLSDDELKSCYLCLTLKPVSFSIYS